MTEKSLIKKYFSNENFYNSDIINNKEIEENHTTDIALVYSGRNRGKSFDISAKAIMRAWYSNGADTFGYIRRYDKELQNYRVEEYFSDKVNFIKDLTNNKCNTIVCEKAKIYLAKSTNENGKLETIKVLQIGNVFSLNLAIQYKSLQFPNIHTLIFEEVFATTYITDEVNKLLSIISTVKRSKENFICFLISNLVSKINPYTQGFALKGILKQKPGTIDEYKLYLGTLDENNKEEYYYICVEYLKDKEKQIDISNKNKKQNKNRILNSPTSNKWEESKLYPCISQGFIKEFKTIHCCVFEYNEYKYLCELKLVPINIQEVYNELMESDTELEYNNELMEICFVSRKTSKILNNTRLFTTNPTVLPYSTRGYYLLNEDDDLIDRLITIGHTFYSDNLTANEFKQAVEEIKSYC